MSSFRLGIAALCFSLANGGIVAAEDAKEAKFTPGTYYTRISESEIADPSLRVNAGLWQAVFRADGSYRVYRDRALVGEGGYSTKGGRIAIADNAVVCRGLGNGTYSFVSDGKTLQLTLVTDRCSHRRLVLTIHTWKKQ